MIRDQDRVEIRLTHEAEYRLPFTFIEALMRHGSTGCFTS
jgi:hypothetical protein